MQSVAVGEAAKLARASQIEQKFNSLWTVWLRLGKKSTSSDPEGLLGRKVVFKIRVLELWGAKMKKSVKTMKLDVVNPRSKK